MGAEAAKLELVPRASAKAIVASIAAARQARCEKLAKIVAQSFEGVGDRVWGEGRNYFHIEPLIPNPRMPRVDSSELHPKPNTQHPQPHRLKSMLLSAKIERAVLSPGMRRDQPGRYARIVLRLPHERVGVTATVRHVLLRESLRQRIELWEIDDEWEQAHPARPIERKTLWKKRLTRFPPVSEAETSARAKEIVSQAPHAIDIVDSRHGQTLRYHGLPFARLRHVMNRDRLWFGIEGSRRRALDEYHERDWAKLFADLQVYRHEDCRDRRHWYYRSAGEAWLESILRRDITKLDPGLIIAPLHAQYRSSQGGPTGARPIDLLALRHDGRLVVIELKVNEDREHVFQGVDYWRRVEAHRRRGHISSAKLFGEREISDESPLVYLVAPSLRFHPSFRTLARMIAPDVEIYRFDINEDWRSGVRVVRRERVNA